MGAVRHPHRGVLTTTNHFQSPAMQELKGTLSPPSPLFRARPYHFTEAYSQARNQRLQHLARTGRWAAGSPKDSRRPAVANAGTVVVPSLLPPTGSCGWPRARPPR